jgi:hypothetical protein
MRLFRKLPIALLVAGLVASPLLHGASRTTGTHSSNNPGSTSHHRSHYSSKTTKKASKSRKPNAYQRLSRMQIDPGRVQNIQRALSDAGTYHGTPSGQWDASTRAAMSLYQAQNGFGVTGLPDAKSLMKLGLGPHPLPAELDKTRASNLPPNPGGIPDAVSADSASPGEPSSISSPAVASGGQPPPR